MNVNLERFDLSEWLIHFTRAIDLRKADAAPGLPEEWGFGESVEKDVLSPFFLLRRILRRRQVLSSWAVRSKHRTVYGRRPAVCFTEMPIAAFLEAGEGRAARGQNMSPYAVLLPKGQAFRAGARPAIYGLSNPAARSRELADDTRLFPAEVLAEVEQYRYVAFDRSQGGRLDWTHEREWRWPNPRHVSFRSYEMPDEGSPDYDAWLRWNDARETDRYDGDGLCLDGGQFAGVGFLVKNARQGKLLTHDILSLVDAGRVPPELFGFIMQRDQLPDRKQLVDPVAVRETIAAATISLEPFFELDPSAAHALCERFDHAVQAIAADHRCDIGESGTCWLWLTNNMHPLTRALAMEPRKERRLRVSRVGRYLVELPEFVAGRGLQLREDLTRALAKVIRDEFGAAATYFSVSNSNNIDGVPFYTDIGAFDNDVYMNRAHNQDDF